MTNKIYYNVSVDTDGLGWIWLDEELTKSILYKVDASSVKIYCSKNTADDGGNIPTRVGHVMFWQIGEDCSLAKTVLVTQNGGEASYSYSVLGEESIYITEETTGIRNYVINTIDSTNVNFIGYYSADVVVTKTINGNKTAIQKEVNILLSSTNFPDFFEWGDVAEPSGLTKVNNIGGYRAIGGGTWQIPISLNNNGINYIKNLFSGYTPSVTEGYGELVQTGGTAYTLLVNPILPCSRELSIELRKNNVEITDYDLTWRISGTSITGSGVTIDPNYTTEDVIYRLTIHAGENTITGTSKQPGNPLTGESVPYVFTADSNPVTIPYTGETDMTNLIVSYYNDFCDGSILPLSLSATTQTSWISNVSISATNEANFYLLKYNVDSYENKDEDREGEILINQEKTGLQLKLTIKQLRKPSATYIFNPIEVDDGCISSLVNPQYTVTKISEGQEDKTLTYTYDGVLEFTVNGSGAERIVSSDTWVGTAEEGVTGYVTVNQASVTQSDYTFNSFVCSGSAFYSTNNAVNLSPTGGTLYIKVQYNRCDEILDNTIFSEKDTCQSPKDYGEDWITYSGVTEDGFHVFNVETNVDGLYYGTRNGTISFISPDEATSGKTIAEVKIIQLGGPDSGELPACINLEDYITIKSVVSELPEPGTYLVRWYAQNKYTKPLRVEYILINYNGGIIDPNTLIDIVPPTQGGGWYSLGHEGGRYNGIWQGYAGDSVFQILSVKANE